LKSCEELFEDHDVEYDDAQLDLLVLGAVSAGREGRAQASLYHAEERLDLPSLVVLLMGEVPTHLLPARTPQRSVWVQGQLPTLGRDDALSAKLAPDEAMVILSVIGGVAEQLFEALVAVGLADGLVEVQVVRAGAASVADHAQRQVGGGIANHGHARISALFASPATTEVVADVAGFQSRGIYGYLLADLPQQALLASPAEGALQQAARSPFFSSR
jgi:hypothetical protein